MNPRVRALGETGLRVKDLEATALHHFAIEIDRSDFEAELTRLRIQDIDFARDHVQGCSADRPGLRPNRNSPHMRVIHR
jgi:hypothetical protein